MFHICTADGEGGLSKYSFLCPNGTIFNQNYFICDWWFNFDCAEAESLYARNDEIRAEQEANIGATSDEGSVPVYEDNLNGGDTDYATYDYTDDLAPVDATEAPLAAYGTNFVDETAPVDNGDLAPVDEVPLEEVPAAYGAPAEEIASETRDARRFRGGRNRGFGRSRSNRRRPSRRNRRPRTGRRLNGRRSGRRNFRNRNNGRRG